MRRDDALERLGNDDFDLLVVGGGVTGCGVALDAALRGLNVGLVEKDDYASGTSSKSSKLIHGGLRYLAHLEIGLVRESLAERGVLRRMAPHLCRPTPFLIPRYGRRRLIPVRMGLQLYDVLSVGSGFPRHRSVDTTDALKMAPSLRPDVDGGLVYWDARTDDARLTWTVLRTAVEHGAVAVNHVRLDELDTSEGRVRGASVTDTETGRPFGVSARVVVNAGGVWADEIRALKDPVGIRPSKGIHIVLPHDRIPVNTALGIPAPDGRYVFVIPWEAGRVLVGTTDEDYPGDLDTPRAHKAEIDYLLDVVNRVLASPLGHDDVVASYAGLRPLIQKPGESTKDLSRRHKVIADPAGVVAVTGGKLTTWRPMAVDTVDAALEVGGFDRRPPSTTAQAHLAGGETVPGLAEELASTAGGLGLDPREGERLWERYGSRATDVLDLVARDEALGELLTPERPYLRAEAVYAIEEEEARTPDDVLGRRLRVRITTSDRGLGCLPWVCDRLGGELGWSAEERRRQAEAYRRDVERDREAEKGA